MSNYASLKATINANIKTNGNQEITGSVLNAVLNAMVNTIGDGYRYAGVATPATNPSVTDNKVFYIAATAGTYTNFGRIIVGQNEVAILKYDTSWSKDVPGIATQSQVDRINEKVFKEFTQVSTHTYQEATIHGLPLYQTGVIDTSIPETYKCSNFIDISNAKRIDYEHLFPAQHTSGNPWSGLVLYDSNRNFVASFVENVHRVATDGTIDLSSYPTAKYMRFAPFYNEGGTVDQSAKVEITSVLGYDELLYHSDIANNFLGEVGKVLSAERGKDLHDAIEEINEIIRKSESEEITYPYNAATEHGLPDFQTGVVDTSVPSSYKCSPLIDISNATRVVYVNLFPTQQNTSGNHWSGLVLYDENQSFIGAFALNPDGIPTSGTLDLTSYPTAKYLRFAPYYNGSGVVDPTAYIVITYLSGGDSILFKSDIADNFLGGVGKVLSANKGKELYELCSNTRQVMPSDLEVQSYYIAARYQQTPNGGMIQRKTDVPSLSSKQIAIKQGEKITLKTTSVGTAWAYYVTDRYGVILSTNGSVSFDGSFVVEFANAEYLCVNLLSGNDFSLATPIG